MRTVLRLTSALFGAGFVFGGVLTATLVWYYGFPIGCR